MDPHDELCFLCDFSEITSCGIGTPRLGVCASVATTLSAARGARLRDFNKLKSTRLCAVLALGVAPVISTNLRLASVFVEIDVLTPCGALARSAPRGRRHSPYVLGLAACAFARQPLPPGARVPRARTTARA